jgi:hypothetical protein
MTRLSQRGMLLLPVALTLALIGTLAYTLTREGSMQVSAVDAEYDTEVARYLAESGVHLARWQTQKAGCKEVSFGTVDLPGGRVEATKIDLKSKSDLRVSLKATASRGTVRTLTDLKTTVYDITKVEPWTSKSDDGTDTTIVKDSDSILEKTDTLALTDDTSRALLKFGSIKDLENTTAHRVTRDWTSSITWAQLGDAWAPAESASVAIGDGLPKAYMLDIAGLADAWTSKTIINQGVLLKSSGLLNARFHSLDTATGSNRPKLVVRYHPRCS